MKIRIGMKIMIAFGVIIALIFMVSIAGITGLNTLNADYEIIVEERLPVANMVEHTRALALEQVAAVRGYIIYREAGYLSLYAGLNKAFEQYLQEVDLKVKTQESKDLLNQLYAEHDAYDQKAQDVLALVTKGDIDGAVKLASEIKYHVDNMKKITDDMIAWVGSVNEATYDEIQTEMRNILIIISVLVALALIGSIAIAIYLNKAIAKPIIEISKIAEKIASGDLTQEVPHIKSKDEIYDLGQAFKLMINNLNGLIRSVNAVSQDMVASSEELAASSEEVTRQSEQTAMTISDLAKGSTDQVVSSELGNVKIKQMLEGLNDIIKEMVHTDGIAQNAKSDVESGQSSVRIQESKMNDNKQMSEQVSLSISELAEKSSEIGQILEVIRSIAGQTNLLALNAAIEAARAGEAGKGFAVVADEIRKLAEQSSLSAQQIGEIIKAVQTNVASVVTLTDQSKVIVGEQMLALSDTITAFNKISNVVDTVTEKVGGVAEASKKLGLSAAEIEDAITEISCVAEEAAAGTQELAASVEEQTSTIMQVSMAAEDLSTLANTLQTNVMKFQI